MAGLYEYYGEGHYPLEDFPPEPDPVVEFYSEAKVEQGKQRKNTSNIKIK